MSSRNQKKSKNSGSQEPKKPSPTAQILEHVELLVALQEELSEQNGSAQLSATPDTSAMVDDIAQKLESQFVKRFDSLEDQIANSGSKHDSDNSNFDSSSLESIIEKFDSLESKLTAIESRSQDETDGPSLSATKIQERFDALEDRLEKVTAAIEGQQKLIEERNQNTDSSDTDALQFQFSEMLSQMKLEMTSIINSNSDQQLQTDDAPASETNWSRQKQDMLSKYNIDPEHRPDMALPTASDPVLETTLADEELSASLELSPIESASTDPEEIQKIKQELNEKLRDAEVELSIERAKLSQLRAELDAKQTDLERRNKALNEKIVNRKINRPALDSDSYEEDEISILDRLKKHLTAKDRKNLDRI